MAGLSIRPRNPSSCPSESRGTIAPPNQVTPSRAGRNTVCSLSTLSHDTFADPANLVDLKRELVSEQVRWEINELNTPTALRRFGAPFKSEHGEISPEDSELPILRYIFVHHIRDFPFLDKAREKEFWQDKLQVVRLEMAQPPRPQNSR